MAYYQVIQGVEGVKEPPGAFVDADAYPNTLDLVRIGVFREVLGEMPGRAVATETTGTKPVDAKVSAAAARLIEQHGLDPSQITGSGAGGKITKPDVDAFLKG